MMTLHPIPLLLLGTLSLLSVPALANEKSYPTHPHLAAIQRAHEMGAITESEALLYRAYAAIRSPLLPAEFRREEAGPLKCATPYLLELRADLERMPAHLRDQAEALFVRPNLNAYIDTPHFRVHYSTSGANMIYGWPDPSYRNAVMEACETSWSLIHTTRGWREPCYDGTMGGGFNLIDCYVDELESGYYGLTYAERDCPYFPNDWTAYFLIDNDYAGFGYPDPRLPMRVTVAHEYHHVVQMGLNAGSPWFMENTSTYMEDEVFDDINDNYGYLYCYFLYPRLALNTVNDCFEYACFIWPKYLSENWGHWLVRDIWTRYATQTDLFTAFDERLAPLGKTFNTAVAEWTRWNVFTYTRHDGNHYSEGGFYNQIGWDNDISDYPVTNRHPSPGRWPQGLGSNLTIFRSVTGSPDNRISITYQMNHPCSYNHVIEFARKFEDENVWEEYEIPVDSQGQARFELSMWNRTDYMFMVVPMRWECGPTGQDFQFDAYTVCLPADVAGTARPTRTIYLDPNSPNPFHPPTAIRFSLPSDTSVRLEVHDASGRSVRTLFNGFLTAGEHEVHWGGTDGAGRMVAKGVYFYSLEAAGERVFRKMQMIE